MSPKQFLELLAASLPDPSTSTRSRLLALAPRIEADVPPQHLTREVVDSSSICTSPASSSGKKTCQVMATGDPLYHVVSTTGDVSTRPYVGPDATRTWEHPHASVCTLQAHTLYHAPAESQVVFM